MDIFIILYEEISNFTLYIRVSESWERLISYQILVQLCFNKPQKIISGILNDKQALLRGILNDGNSHTTKTEIINFKTELKSSFSDQKKQNKTKQNKPKKQNKTKRKKQKQN